MSEIDKGLLSWRHGNWANWLIGLRENWYVLLFVVVDWGFFVQFSLQVFLVPALEYALFQTIDHFFVYLRHFFTLFGLLLHFYPHFPQPGLDFLNFLYLLSQRQMSQFYLVLSFPILNLSLINQILIFFMFDFELSFKLHQFRWEGLVYGKSCS